MVAATPRIRRDGLQLVNVEGLFAASSRLDLVPLHQVED